MAGKGKQPITATTVSGYAKELRSWGSALADLANQMDEQGVEDLPVMGEPNVKRAIGYIQNFAQSVERELRDKRLGINQKSSPSR